MASLRDVLNHAGKKVKLRTGAETPREGLAVLRGDVGLVEPKLVPKVGDTLELLGSGERFLVAEAHAEHLMEKVDHFRCKLVPARG